MKMNAKDILTPTVSLFIICLVATLLLAVVNNVTFAKIQEQTAKAEAEARVAVLPDAKDFKEVKRAETLTTMKVLTQTAKQSATYSTQ